MREGELHNFECALRCKDKNLITARFEGHARLDGDGETIFEGFIENITDRKRSELELRHVNRALSTLSRCNEALVHASDEAHLLNEICEIAVQVGGYRLAWVGFAENDNAKSVSLKAKSGYDEGYIEGAQISWGDTERGSGPAGKSIKTGEPCILHDLQQNSQFLPWRDEAVRRGYASVISLPLREGSHAIGVLNIYASESDAFDKPEVELLRELASDLAYGIISLRNATERGRAETALRESEERYRMLFERNPQPMWICDMESHAFLVVNDAAVAHYGYSREEFQKMTIESIRPLEDVPLLLGTLPPQNAVTSSAAVPGSKEGWERHLRRYRCVSIYGGR